MLRTRASAQLWEARVSAAADRHTMDHLGVPSPILMERAALVVSHEIVELCATEALPVLVLVGPGNNGGDGLAVARQLHGWGIRVHAILATRKHNDAVQQQLAISRAVGVPVEDHVPAQPPHSQHLVVDALLGTGSKGEPRGGVAEVLQWQRGIVGPRVAIDVPSGVDVDTGAAAGDAFEAHLTVSFVRSKPGLHVTPGRRHAGRVVVADIGIVAVPGTKTLVQLTDPSEVTAKLRALPAGRHKGERGHVGVVGGSETTAGATVLSATAALRAGAGLVTIVTRAAAVREQLIAHRPELMVSSWGPEGDPLPAAGALVVGPGLTDPRVQSRLGGLWTADARPAVWDASALDHVPLGVEPPAARIVTPHPGEAARMLERAQPRTGWSARRVQAHRLSAARELAESTRAIVILKGEGTIVAAPGGCREVAVTGGPALATAGTGDCLAGLVGALLARGMSTWDAARVGVHVHGLAGDIAAARHPGCIAMHVADAIGEATTEDALSAPTSGWPRLRLG